MPLAVIKVLNHLRDDIQQTPADNNSQGEALYLFARDEKGLASAQAYLQTNRGWSLAPAETKQLFLTHRLIARRRGYADLIQVYGDRGGFFREDLLGGEDRTIAFFIDKVEALSAAWRANDHGSAISILKKNGFQLTSNESKRAVREALDKLEELRLNSTVKQVVLHIQSNGLFNILEELDERIKMPRRDTSSMDDKDAERENRDAKFFEDLLKLPYSQVAAFVDFFLNHTPFATKHGVKGAEFPDVIVVLDDQGARWTQYSFDKYLGREEEGTDRWRRTRNLFYVCCSRAKNRLAIIDLGGRSNSKMDNVRKIFGTDNVLAID